MSEKVPGRHAVQEEAPISENSPAEQDEQAALVDRPVPDWKVPAWQDWQVLEMFAPLAVEYVPTPHLAQLTPDCRPIPVKKVPAGQDWQVLDIVAPLAVE